MKKLLIASAALAMVAGTAQAQSSVTVYGVVDIAVTNTENTTTTNAGVSSTVKQKNTGNGDGGLSTSVIGFRGTEDLGGGTKAEFQLEYDLVDAGIGGNGNKQTSTTTADAATTTNGAAGDVNGFGARQSWVGLNDSKMGSLRLGRQAQAVHGVVAAGSAGGANNIAGTIYSAGQNAAPNDASIRPQNVYLNRAVTYISPAMNGVVLQLQASNSTIDNAGTSTSAKETGGSLTYSAGKLALGAGYALTKLDGATNDEKQTQTALTASYDLGVVKAFALHTKRKVQDVDAAELDSDTKATELGLQMPLGKTTLFTSAFSGSRKGLTTGSGSAADAASEVAAVLAVGEAKVRGYQIGAKYDLSKRTTAYAIVGSQYIKGTGVTDADLKQKSEGVAFGLRHSF